MRRPVTLAPNCRRRSPAQCTGCRPHPDAFTSLMGSRPAPPGHVVGLPAGYRLVLDDDLDLPQPGLMAVHGTAGLDHPQGGRRLRDLLFRAGLLDYHEPGLAGMPCRVVLIVHT